MKRNLICLVIVLMITSTLSEAFGQEFKEKLNKEFTVSGDPGKCTLFIYNISGFIRIEGISGNKVTVEMDKTISADNNKILEAGKKEFRLAFDQKPDTIIAYIAEPFDSRPRKNWHNNNRRIDYEFNVDFVVKVPENMSLHISTVNNGDISVKNVKGTLHINNVNEGITISGAKGTTYAHTVNGDISVDYLTNPSEESSYYTINGDINVSYKPDLSADIRFKSMNGDLFTDFPDTQLQPATVVKIQDKSDGRRVYKLNSSTSVRFGKGGSLFKFETLNGNVYIKRQS